MSRTCSQLQKVFFSVALSDGAEPAGTDADEYRSAIFHSSDEQKRIAHAYRSVERASCSRTS
jgi:peptide methionine sulfoxide reductase MsrA